MGNAVILALLGLPLGQLLGALCELQFTGRRTGTTVRLPVQYARAGDRLVIHVRHAASKQW